MTGFIDRYIHSRWQRRAQEAPRTPLGTLSQQSRDAEGLRASLRAFQRASDDRLAKPLLGDGSFPTPHGTIWMYRPDLWRRSIETPSLVNVAQSAVLNHEVKLFHDCPVGDILVSQRRVIGDHHPAPFAMQFEFFQFAGSYFSAVLDLPPDGARGLSMEHLLRVELEAEAEVPMQSYLRLNIKHGPNTESIVRGVEFRPGEVTEFDLAYCKINEKRIEGAWMEIIFNDPSMNRVLIRDMRLSSRLRAEI